MRQKVMKYGRLTFPKERLDFGYCTILPVCLIGCEGFKPTRAILVSISNKLQSSATDPTHMISIGYRIPPVIVCSRGGSKAAYETLHQVHAHADSCGGRESTCSYHSCRSRPSPQLLASLCKMVSVGESLAKISGQSSIPSSQRNRDIV